MNVTEWGPEELSAVASLGTLSIATLALWFARSQVLQARTAHSDQTRPHVLVDFEFSQQSIFVSVQNIGSTEARDVRIAFDRPFEPANIPADEANKIGVINRPIAMLAPGRKILIKFDKGFDVFDREDLPHQYEATAWYRDSRGRLIDDDPPTVLDLDTFKYSIIPRRGIAELAESVAALQRDIHRLTQSGHLRVRTTSADRQKRVDRRATVWYSGRHIVQTQGWRAGLRWARETLFR